MRINLLLLFFVFLFSACSQPEARKPVARKSKSILQESALLNKKILTNELLQIDAYVKNDSTQTYIDSGNSYVYSYIHKTSEGNLPVKGDVVSFEQELLSLQNEVIKSKENIGIRNYYVDKEHIIQGLEEGLKLMRTGEEIKFIFSSFVAFGATGSQEFSVGVYQPIVCKIKILKINKTINQ